MGQTLSAFWDQTYFIPQPIFTGEDIPDQTGKVHIITGGYTGIGLELVKLVYPKNATIYIAGRNTEKGLKAVKAVKSEFPASKGRLEFLKLDLADLSTIKASVEEFLRKEERLDVLTNNAGIMVPRKGSKSKQGHDLQTATNIYGPFLFTSLLLPLFKRTVSLSNTGSVRVTWASSFAIEIMAPKGGVEFGDDGLVKDLAPEPSYGQSKAANVMLGVETARRWGDGGIISNSWNPGHLKSELDRHSNFIQIFLMSLLRHPVKMGAYTELFAGWSPEITPEKNGCYIIPWGRFGSYNEGLQKAIKRKEDGGEAKAKMLWEACERVTMVYM